MGRVTGGTALLAGLAIAVLGASACAGGREGLEEEAKEIVAEAVADLANSGIDAEGVASEGDADDGILGHADASGADIIIIGRGLAGVKDYPVGSVAERVIRHAEVPVLVVT